MIYCNLKGGLANMMFQIAATKSFSIDLGVDCSFPNLDNMINYLNIENTYNPKMNHADEYRLVFRNLKKDNPNKPIKTINFPFEYSNIFLPKNEDFFVDGFFQSEKYFKHNRDKILELFNVDLSIKKIIESKYSFLNNKKTTSIHVRRGDYIKYPNHHPIQSINYYMDCINMLEKDTDIFVIFSDDIEWCKENLKNDKCYFIENEKDYVELYLMSICNNNIICNSSFSWWGAWMNENKNKKVMGPKKWFGPAITHSSDDIIPEEWIKL